MGTILLMDGNSIINRAYFGVKSTTTLSTADGTPTNAVFGFVNILNRYLEDIKPDRVAVAFDTKSPTFRHEMYEKYKGDRKGMPDELAVQMPMLKDYLDAMRIFRVQREGLEADDFIGILSHMGEEAGEQVVIVTGDRDVLQLVSDHVTVMIPSTGKTGTETNTYTPKAVLDKYGVPAAALIEVKGLMGDPSDNIPGVPSVGEKTALDLILRFGSIEAVYDRLDEITKPALHKNLEEHRDLAFLSRTLGIIVRDPDSVLPEGFLHLDRLDWPGPDRRALRSCFERLEFRSLIRKFKLEDADISYAGNESADAQSAADRPAAVDLPPAIRVCSVADLDEMAGHLARNPDADCALVLVDLTGTATGDAWLVRKDEPAEEVLFSPPAEWPGDAPRNLVVVVSGAGHRWTTVTDGVLTERLLVQALDRVLKERTVHCHDMKAIAHFFTANGMHPPTGLFDTMLAEYLLDPSRDRYVLRDLAVRHLGREGETPDRLLADARRQVVPPDQILAAAEHAADVLPDIGHAQQLLMEANGQTVLYETIERPLAIVLEEMEREGFRVDPDMLAEYGRTLQTRILALEKEIHRLAGEAFNILSPKQLGIILFEKLNLPAGKKTKTGYSTDADVLEALADEHAIIPALLEYRQYTKLKSTYADGLLKVISPVTGRVHSSFNQTVAVTGRISSTEPNLQNIPIRTEAGRLIRKAFLPKDGYLFVDADYSQIELRVLAHVTGDETLKSAFHNGTDIHALTASQVFNVPLSEVTSEMRRRAKAVNFGIIYGISDYGLSRDLGIYRKEASAYIEGYLNTYPGVRHYMEAVVEQARKAGYVETLLHRRRYLPELKSANFNIRSFGKRIALNTPIQGTAADIIKIAMIRVRDALLVRCPAAKLILQVHDELVVETPSADVSLVEDVVRECMEHAMILSVPIAADVGHGPNWYDAKH